jgi:flagellar motor switch protein FliN/FliY
MTEDKTKDGDQPVEENPADNADVNHSGKEAPVKSGGGPDEENGDNAVSSGPEESAALENTQNETPFETSAGDPNGAEEIQAVEDFDLNLLLDIPLEITVELGRNRVRIQRLLELEPGSTVTLSKLEGEPVDILANDKLIARGEVVLQNKKYGIRITEITSRMNRIKSLH